MTPQRLVGHVISGFTFGMLALLSAKSCSDTADGFYSFMLLTASILTGFFAAVSIYRIFYETR